MFEKFFMFSHLSHNNIEDAFPITKGLGLFFLAGRTFMLSETFIFPCMLDLQNWGCLSVI